MLGMNELAATTSTSSGGGFPTSTLLFIVIIVAVVYFLMIRPQQRRKQQAQQQQNTIQPGARVVTTAGMYATVVAVDGDDVVLEVAPGVEMRYMKRAIMNVVSPPEADETPGEETSEDYAAERPSDAAEQGDDTAGDAPESDADAGETAYEQATGTKKD